VPLVRLSKKSKSVRKWNKQRRQQLIFWLRCYAYSISRRIEFALWVETWKENLVLFQVALFWTSILLACCLNYNKFRSSWSSKTVNQRGIRDQRVTGYIKMTILLTLENSGCCQHAANLHRQLACLYLNILALFSFSLWVKALSADEKKRKIPEIIVTDFVLHGLCNYTWDR